MSTLLYHCDPVTGVYRGSSPAVADPLELQLARQAVREPLVLAADGARRLGLDQAVLAYNLALRDADEDVDALVAAAAIRDIALADAEAVFNAAMAAAEAAASDVQPVHWLIPAHAVTIQPPAFGFDEEAVYTEGAWLVRPMLDPAEDEAPLDPSTEAEVQARAVRLQRNIRIGQARWLIDRHRDETALGLTTTLVQADYFAVLSHVQALRDLPEQDGFPLTVEWPELDEAIAGLID